jgi:hypothetical protein
VGQLARENRVRLSFHPGQFTVLASSYPGIVDRSIEEFEYHTDMARWMGYGKTFQDFKINVHISGREGPEGIRRALTKLSPEARNCITIENDEMTWGIDSSIEYRHISSVAINEHTYTILPLLVGRVFQTKPHTFHRFFFIALHIFIHSCLHLGRDFVGEIFIKRLFINTAVSNISAVVHHFSVAVGGRHFNFMRLVLSVESKSIFFSILNKLKILKIYKCCFVFEIGESFGSQSIL